MSNYKSLYTSLFKEDPPLILGSCEDNREVFVGMEDVQASKLALHHQCSVAKSLLGLNPQMVSARSRQCRPFSVTRNRILQTLCHQLSYVLHITIC